jgi:hypothetical protein
MVTATVAKRRARKTKPAAKSKVAKKPSKKAPAIKEEKQKLPHRGPNVKTMLAREAIAKFVDENSWRLQDWLDKIADGVPPEKDPRGHIIPMTGSRPNPKLAFELFQSVIEYHVPKLARTELAGDPNNPIGLVHSITRQIISPQGRVVDAAPITVVTVTKKAPAIITGTARVIAPPPGKQPK